MSSDEEDDGFSGSEPCLAVQQQHTADVKGVCFSPDGNRIVTGSKDMTVAVYDLETKASLVVGSHTAYVGGVSWHPDGELVASGGGDSLCKLWSPNEAREPVHTYRHHAKTLNTVSFSPDRRTLGTGADDNRAGLVDIETGQVRMLSLPRGIVWSVNFSHDGQLVAAGAWDTTITLWDVRSMEVARVIHHNRDVNGVSFSPDDRQIAFGADDSNAMLCDVGSGDFIRTYRGHGLRVLSCCFSPEGTCLATGSADNTARIWHLNGDQETEVLRGHIDTVTGVHFSNDGLLATSSFDRTARIWRPQSMEEGLPPKGATTRLNDDGPGDDEASAHTPPSAQRDIQEQPQGGASNKEKEEREDEEKAEEGGEHADVDLLFRLPWTFEAARKYAVLAIGANPALQKTLRLADFAPGQVNRCDGLEVGFGGKGQVFSRAAHTLNPGCCTVLQFVGGPTGDTICSKLDELGVPHCDVRVAGNTRTCTTVISTQTQASWRETEIIEPSEPVDESNTQEFIEAAVQQLRQWRTQSRRCAMAIQGTCPPGCGPEFYKDLCTAVNAAGNTDCGSGSSRPLVMLDGYKNVLSLLHSAMVEVLKINLGEFAKLSTELGYKGNVGGDTETDAVAWVMPAGAFVLEQCNLRGIVLTDGGKPAYLLQQQGDKAECHCYALPEVQLNNAIGCGDTTGAALLCALLVGVDMAIAVRYALAVACAAAETSHAGEFTDQRIRQHYDGISVTRCEPQSHPKTTSL